ncbi:hypothetical protein JNB88_29080 [Rhizobium cauense]|uniref:hypothetical protein n=1 Tax=Rhizobium cauense TaxID=1166683 RepID=UPI001C6E962F|nr:hypothetical protein [Rhizobium cauense]MBW9117675.1 hypothetical protein [Rhizobium cauense]
MAKARRAFNEILAEIDNYRRPNAVEFEWRWIAEYFTRQAIFYQFSGSCHAHVASGNGQRFDGPTGTMAPLSAHVAVAAFAEFAENGEIAFYRGVCTSVSTIAAEILKYSARDPEIFFVDIVADLGDIAPIRCNTRLAFVGFNHDWSGLSSSMACDDLVASDSISHPIWCRDRYQPRPPRAT